MSYNLYRAEIQIIGNGAVKTKIAYSLDKDEGSKFFSHEKSQHHNESYGTVKGEMIRTKDIKLVHQVEQASKKGVYGIWKEVDEEIIV